MKKQIMNALLGLAVVTTLAVSAYAQSGRRMTVHIPFDFVVSGKQMPAGDYSVRRVSKDSEGALLIQSEDGRRVATVFTNASAARATSSPRSRSPARPASAKSRARSPKTSASAS
jgi:hypothetical protein